MATDASQNRKVRVAIVGAGDQANYVHYPSIASMKDVEIAAICDIDPERLKTTADKYGIEKRYGADRDPLAYRKMIEQVAPEAVYVIGQPNIMYDIWVWCLQQKLNLFIEKPMGVNLHSARNLARLADSFAAVPDFSVPLLEDALRKLALELNVKAAVLIHPCRVALTGKTVGPPLFDVIQVLGRETTLKRLRG